MPGGRLRRRLHAALLGVLFSTLGCAYQHHPRRRIRRSSRNAAGVDSERATTTRLWRRTNGSSAPETASLPVVVVADKSEREERRRASELRCSIALQCSELERLERSIASNAVDEEWGDWPLVQFYDSFTSTVLSSLTTGASLLSLSKAFARSGNVFARLIGASRDPTQFVYDKSVAGLRIGMLLLSDQKSFETVQEHAPLLMTHAPGIYSRLDKLEDHVPGIVATILVGGYLKDVEPHLDAILERLDDIAPHIPWVLKHIEKLAPHVGDLLEHIDELLLYADEEHAWADEFVPYLGPLAGQLDTLGPHLALLRPHARRLAPHMQVLTPIIKRVYTTERSIDLLHVSANADVLLFYFGWVLRLPAFVPRTLLKTPGVPRFLRFAARRLPKRLVRGDCADIECHIDKFEYGDDWNRIRVLADL